MDSSHRGFSAAILVIVEVAPGESDHRNREEEPPRHGAVEGHSWEFLGIAQLRAIVRDVHEHEQHDRENPASYEQYALRSPRHHVPRVRSPAGATGFLERP